MAQYLDTAKVDEMYKAFRATLPRRTYKYMLDQFKAMEEDLRTDAGLVNAGFGLVAVIADVGMAKAAGVETTAARSDHAHQLVPGLFHFLPFTGSNLAGACACVGLKEDDVVVGIINVTDSSNDASKFESTITVTDQIQQSAAENLSTKKFMVIALARS